MLVAVVRRIHYRFPILFEMEEPALTYWLQLMFMISCGIILIPILLYPLALFLLGLLFPRGRKHSFKELPFVSVMVAARNEEKCIGQRIRNLLDQDYPVEKIEILVASDSSTDSTDEIIRSFDNSRVRFVRSEERLGKSSLMVKLSKIARGDILVFTDANTSFRSNTVTELVMPFADPRVGCVDGSKQNSLAQETCESTYWKYEQQLKALGSRLGAVLGATGAVFAVRKDLYDPVNPSRADDFETAVSTRIKGYSCLYNPDAVAAEPTPDNSSQYSRLVRIVSWMIGSAFSLLWKSIKNGRIGLALQLVIHKILRWNMGIFAILASISGLALGFSDGPLNSVFLSVIGFYLLVIVGWKSTSRLPSVIKMPYFFWLMCAASLKGVFVAVSAKSAAIWDPGTR
ncbi:hypothetical protein CSA37_04275 [Candidatus Fermentibacteria bacterium]|nr:MAG: hypothetical protein CSA37_04275 [Candidatus Fermentibacteria bacterium]